MAYRRFVSYIYEYSSGKKGENRGFVRVEVKNGICRMGFGVEIADLPEKCRIRVLGIVRENRKLLGIPLGEMTVGSGGIRGQVRFPEQQVGSSPYHMEQMGGLLLVSEGGRQFATQWDDEPLRLEWLEEWKPKQERDPKKNHVENHMEHHTEIREEKKEPVKQLREIPEGRQPESVREPEEQQAKPKNQSKDERVRDPDAKGRPEAELWKEAGRPVREHSRSGEEKQTERPEKGREPEQRTECPETEPGNGMGCAGQKTQKYDAEKTEAGVDRTSGTFGWEQIRNLCTHCQPFHDDLLTECVKVTRQDLWQLRRSGWQIDSSQFQNYGLDRYGHLLLCRDAADPEAFYLGVPGIFSTNEQFMAGLFGFYHFRPAKPPAEGPARPKFGYWCRRISPGFPGKEK